MGKEKQKPKNKTRKSQKSGKKNLKKWEMIEVDTMILATRNLP